MWSKWVEKSFFIIFEQFIELFIENTLRTTYKLSKHASLNNFVFTRRMIKSTHINKCLGVNFDNSSPLKTPVDELHLSENIEFLRSISQN